MEDNVFGYVECRSQCRVTGCKCSTSNSWSNLTTPLKSTFEVASAIVWYSASELDLEYITLPTKIFQEDTMWVVFWNLYMMANLSKNGMEKKVALWNDSDVSVQDVRSLAYQRYLVSVSGAKQSTRCSSWTHYVLSYMHLHKRGLKLTSKVEFAPHNRMDNSYVCLIYKETPK